MLIELSSLDLAIIPKILDNQDVLDAIENLTMAHLEGSHLVSARRPMIEALLKAPLSPRAQNGLRDINRAALYPPPGPLSVMLKLRFDPSKTSMVVQPGPPQIYEVPITWFAKSATVAPTRLMCEGEDDLMFIEIILKEWRRQCQPDWEPCKFTPINLSGGNAVHIFKREVKQTLPPMFVLLDSDTGDKQARTAKNVNAEDRQAPPTVRKILVLQGREIENYVPASLIQAAYLDQPDVLAKLAVAGASVGAAGPEDLKHCLVAGLLGQVVAWLGTRGASRNDLQTALSFRTPMPLGQLAEQIYGWGIARAVVRA